jgi:hypothetical protein
VPIAGLPINEAHRYAFEVHRFSVAEPDEALYPERVLQELDQCWVIPPVAQELGVYPANPR